MRLKSKVYKALESLLGRRFLFRVGRFLYLRARRDFPNNIHTNGELMIQNNVLKGCSSEERIVIFDVGANVGEWTSFVLAQAAKLGVKDRLRIYAFEPVPHLYDLLINRFSKEAVVVPINQALSSQKGIKKMFVVGGRAGTSSLHPVPIDQQTDEIEITATTIDDFCLIHKIDKIHLLKVDTEGHDMEVLLGAETVLSNGAILVCQFEYNHRWIFSRHYLKDVFDFIEGMPYIFGKVTPYGIEVFESWYPELDRFFESNYVLINKTCIGWFDKLSVISFNGSISVINKKVG